MEYIQLLPGDEVFPSPHVDFMQMRSMDFISIGSWVLRQRLQLPFKAGLLGECDCRNRNFFSLSDGDVC